MRYPHRRTEKQLQKKGFRAIAGIDEAGRGAWAGPVLAAAVIMDVKKPIAGVRDSKLVVASHRQELYREITKQAKAWAVGMSSEKYIDRHGIVAATKHAMEQAVAKLQRKPDHLLIDALELEETTITQSAIIDGDYKVYSIAAASIIAKYTRDKYMERMSLRYPHYGFAHHKGYGTNHHYHMLIEHGPCEIHRKSYAPIKAFLEE